VGFDVIGKVRGWEAGKLGSREAGKPGSWKAGKLGNCEARKLGSWTTTKSEIQISWSFKNYRSKPY
jgi:hypothetical protein